jgi:hypothetical protein
VQTFYDRLVASPDYLRVIDEEFIPNRMTMEQYEAELRTKAQMALGAAKEKRIQQPVARGTVIGSPQATVKEQIEALEKMFPEIKIKRQARNEDLLGREPEYRKYLTIDEDGRLQLTGVVNYKEIIDSSELSVIKRKEIIAFLYFMENVARGRSIVNAGNGSVTRSSVYTPCFHMVAASMYLGDTPVVLAFLTLTDALMSVSPAYTFGEIEYILAQFVEYLSGLDRQIGEYLLNSLGAVMERIHYYCLSPIPGILY